MRDPQKEMFLTVMKNLYLARGYGDCEEEW